MNTSLKKWVAGACILALVSMNAAFTNAATPTASISGNSITITNAGNGAGEAVTLVLKQDGNTRTITTDYTVDTSVAGTITVNGVLGTALDGDSNSQIDAANYEISYVTLADVVGAVVVNNITAGTAGSHNITVKATVLPVLTMSVTNTDINFGELTLGGDNTAGTSTDISVLSNGTAFQVQADYTPLLHTDNTTTLPFKINNGGDVATGWNVINQVGYSATAVNTTISYIATPAANQLAGTYDTTVEYTVTGTF